MSTGAGRRPSQPQVPEWVRRWPGVCMGVGALAVSASAVLLHLAHVSPGTASFYRCVLALPLLVPLALAERRHGRPGRRTVALAWAAGVLLAGDMLLWTQAIPEAGAGISTVVVNMQVLLVPLLALVVDRESPGRRFALALPLLLAGLVLTAGLVGGAMGDDPLAGALHAVLAAVCYSGFLFLLRRTGEGGLTRQTYLHVIVAAAVASLTIGAVWHGVDLAPGWSPIGWLLAVAVLGQVLGWLLVALATPSLPAHVGATLLLLTPVGAVGLGAVVLAERPTLVQLAGCALILASGYLAATRPSGDRRVPDRLSPDDRSRANSL